MKRWKTTNGVEIVQVLGGRSNSYLVSSDNGNVLVDTGVESAFIQLQKNMDQLRLTNKNIDVLVLTHTHFDHCQNACAIREQEKCILVMGEKEACYSLSGYTPLPNGTFPITRIISKLGNRIGQSRFGYKPFVADKLINSTLNLDDYNLTLIPTSGHSQGSISVIIDNEIAIVGDTLFGVFRNWVFPPFADDIDGMLKSWEILLNTTCNTFLPGHGKVIKRELLQREFDKHIRKRRIKKSIQ